MSQDVWDWRPMHGPPLRKLGRWLWNASFLGLWVVALFQMIANYQRDPYNPLLHGTAAYGHNEQDALQRGVILGLVALGWIYLVVRPWSFRLGSFWSAGRLAIALGPLVPWTLVWMVGVMHSGGVMYIYFRWLLAVDLFLASALVVSLLAATWRWVPRGRRAERRARSSVESEAHGGVEQR